MAKTLFFVFAIAFCLAGCFPVESPSGTGFADFTFAVAFQDTPSGIYYDRQFDWPTGEVISVELPVWLVDVTLFLMAAVAFGFYVRREVKKQEPGSECTNSKVPAQIQSSRS